MLSVVMATHNDLVGVWPTVHALLELHSKFITEISIVDNDPDGSEGKHVREFVSNLGPIATYHAYKERVGTAAPRDHAIRTAKSPYVLCIDSHVILRKGSLKALANYWTQRPDGKDFIAGPMNFDTYQQSGPHPTLPGKYWKFKPATHMEPVWEAEMFGKWATDDRYETEELFDILMHGCGLFSVHRDHWLGFHPEHRGFGGEEGYIHELYRQAGRKVQCLSALQWHHRFYRAALRYPLNVFDKVRNYILHWSQLGWPLDDIYKHFVTDTKKVTEQQWNGMLSGKGVEEKPCGNCGTGETFKNYAELYDSVTRNPGDIDQHCTRLKELTVGMDVVDAGHRPNITTVAFADAAKSVVTVSSSTVPEIAMLETFGKPVKQLFGESHTTDIPKCDVLFIDSTHTYDYVLAELNKHSPNVKRRIILHDTVIYGSKGEDGKQPGIMDAVRQFIVESKGVWFTAWHYEHQYGLTVLSRSKEDRPPGLPNLIVQGINFTASEIKDIAQGRKRVSLQVANSRHDVCKSNGGRCPSNMRNPDTDRCTSCGCFLSEKPDGKIYRPMDACPLMYWGNSNEYEN